MNWLEQVRNEAKNRSESLPFPGGKEENFRFISLSSDDLGKSSAQHSAKIPSSSLDEGEVALLSLSGEKSTFLGEAKDFEFSSLLTAAANSNLVRSHLSGVTFSEDKFAQMAEAKWANGAFLHISKGVKTNPVRVLFQPTSSQENIRNLYLLDEGASSVIIHEFEGDDSSRFLNELSTIRLAKNAYLHWIIVQRNGKETVSLSRHHIELAESAKLEITVVQLGSKKVQVRQEIRLQGEKSSVSISGAVKGVAEQSFDLWTEVKHMAAKTISGMDYFYVMDGKSRAVFNGLVHIEKNAFETEAYQKAKSLLLGHKATVHAIPKLIIQTDAVKCSHGASVSSVNPEQVHYLQSRGIPKFEAEQMIIRGFTEPVFSRIPTEALYARVEESLPKKEILI